jgi:hypothetical protein
VAFGSKILPWICAPVFKGYNPDDYALYSPVQTQDDRNEFFILSYFF